MNVAAVCMLQRDGTKIYIQPEQARFKRTSIAQISSVAEGCSEEQGRLSRQGCSKAREIDEGSGREVEGAASDADAGFSQGPGAQVQAQTLSGQADAAMRCVGGAELHWNWKIRILWPLLLCAAAVSL
jgi:hypothetical protein